MLRKQTFWGGVHPAGRKELSSGAPLEDCPPPREVVIPLLQHIGKPCTPLVKAGDHVDMGQKIGDGEGLCVPVHASVSGTVKAVEPRSHPSGQPHLAVVIENDFQNTYHSAVPPCADTEALDADALIRRIREAGLVGMGGAMDLVTGARKVIIAMLHTNKGAYKIRKQCTLPLTAVSVVDTIVTEMGVIRVTERGLVLTERFKDYTVEQIQAATEAELIIPTDLKVLETP